MQPVTLTRDQAKAIVSDHQVTDSVVIIGVRNKANRINVYDDTIAILTATDFKAYNGNVDASVYRPGIATLQPGVYDYKIGVHGISHLNLSNAGDKAILDKMIATGLDPDPIEGRFLPHWAFRQAGPVTILRQGQKVPETDKNPDSWPWIDIHRGGVNTTSSLGCQTIHPDFWPHFRDFGYGALRANRQEIVRYILIW